MPPGGSAEIAVFRGADGATYLVVGGRASPPVGAYRGAMSASEVVGTHPEGSTLTVWVVPGARTTEIVGYHGDALRVRVAAAPEHGKANNAVVRILSDALSANVRLVSGASSRRKRFVAVGVSPQDLVGRLQGVFN